MHYCQICFDFKTCRQRGENRRSERCEDSVVFGLGHLCWLRVNRIIAPNFHQLLEDILSKALMKVSRLLIMSRSVWQPRLNQALSLVVRRLQVEVADQPDREVLRHQA